VQNIHFQCIFALNIRNMGFTAIEITGFRSIELLKVDNFKQVNLFVGKNNSGKTTLLESIFILSGATNPRLPLSTNGLRDYKKLQEDDFIVLFNGLTHNKKIVIEGLEADTEVMRTLTIAPILMESVAQNEMTSKITREIKGLTLDYDVKYRKNSGITIKTKLEIKDNSIEVDLKDIQKVGYIEPISSMFLNTTVILQDLAERVSEIIKAKQKHKIISILQQLEPTISDIHTEDEIVYFDIGMERFIPLNMAGDGMKRILSIVTAIFKLRNGILLIDEVDNGLHYSTQETLWKAIILSSQEFNVQIFATTHSDECIEALYNISESDFNGQDIVSLYRVEKNKSGHKVHFFDQELLSTALENNFEIR
jgi:AAA15 family ATPase/GTPase